MSQQANPERSYVRWFEDLDASAVPQVGGKNASLGEMIQKPADWGR